MNARKFHTFILLTSTLFFSACAGTSTVVDSPTVELVSVELSEANFSRQTFLLGFDVSNPNPFPLPVKAIKYRVLLDEEKFAGGETEGSFTVPARGDDEFVISVDLDFLNSTPQLASLLRGGLQEDLGYELQGSLAIDIPLVKPIPFASTGVVKVSTDYF